MRSKRRLETICLIFFIIFQLQSLPPPPCCCWLHLLLSYMTSPSPRSLRRQSRHVTSRHITSRHVMSYHITSQHKDDVITFRRVTSHHVRSAQSSSLLLPLPFPPEASTVTLSVIGNALIDRRHTPKHKQTSKQTKQTRKHQKTSNENLPLASL